MSMRGRRRRAPRVEESHSSSDESFDVNTSVHSAPAVNIITKLTERQLGITSSKQFQISESSHRMFDLSLSSYRSVEEVHPHPVVCLDVDKAEGRYLLSASGKGNIYVHDLFNFTGQLQHEAPAVAKITEESRQRHTASVDTVQWYPYDNGMFVTSGMDKKVMIWDTNALEVVESFTMPGHVYQHDLCAVNANSPLIAAGTSAHHINLIDIRIGFSSHEIRGHASSVLSVQWCPNHENILASGDISGNIYLWDVRSSRAKLASLKQQISSKSERAHIGAVNGLKFTQDGMYLLSIGRDGHINLWNVFFKYLEDVQYTKILNGSEKRVQLDVVQHGRTGAVCIPTENHILISDLMSGHKCALLKGHYRWARCCMYNIHRQELYSGSSDQKILIWTPDKNVEDAYRSYLRSIRKDNSSFLNGSGYEPDSRRTGTDAWSDDERY